jgi:hypothetical protein
MGMQYNSFCAYKCPHNIFFDLPYVIDYLMAQSLRVEAFNRTKNREMHAQDMGIPSSLTHCSALWTFPDGLGFRKDTSAINIA